MPGDEDRVADKPHAPSRVPSPSRRRSGLSALMHSTTHDVELRREADMMGLYVSLTLLTVLLTGNDLDEHSKLDVLWLVWGTTIGLAMAHWFALVLSMRLVRDPHVHHTALEILLSQLLLAALLAIIATLVVLVLPERLDRFGARLSAATFIGAIVYVESRAGGRSQRGAAAFGASALAVALLIATVKLRLSY